MTATLSQPGRTAVDVVPRMRAMIYARISLDRTGQELGVQRQTDAAKALCTARGWDVVEVFEDNDIAALNAGHRPGYTALMTAAARGDGDVIVLYQTSRLWRNRKERAAGIELLAAKRMSIIATQGGDIDLSTAYGRGFAGLMGEFDTLESEVKGERLRSQIEQAAAMGRMMGGGRSYGHRPDYHIVSGDGEKVRRRIITPVRVDPIEGPIVVECAHRVLAGESLASVTRDLNDRAITTTHGKLWGRKTLKRMLCSARIAGYREHHGVIVAQSPDWEPIITLEQCERLRMLLRQPERGVTTGPGRRHVLSGVLVCGRCGGKMIGRMGRYECRKTETERGCRLSISKLPTEEWVTERLLAALDDPEMVRLLCNRGDDTDALYTQIRADEDELTWIADEKGHGRISRAEWSALRAPVVARLETARRQLTEATTRTGSAVEDFLGSDTDMRQRWDDMNVSQQRAILTEVVEAVPVAPGRNLGSNRFDVGRLGKPVYRVA